MVNFSRTSSSILSISVRFSRGATICGCGASPYAIFACFRWAGAPVSDVEGGGVASDSLCVIVDPSSCSSAGSVSF